MRLFLIISLLIILAVDIGVAARVEKYEIDTYANYHQKEQYQPTTLQGPFILGAKSLILWFLDFSNRNDRAITSLSTFVIAIFTIVLAFATGILVKMAGQQEMTSKTIERAYVQMSHVSAPDNPGLEVTKATGKCVVHMSVKNYGNTPARVTRVFMTHRVLPDGQDLPDEPHYSKLKDEPIELPVEAFLVKNSEFISRYLFKVATDDVALLDDGQKLLFVYGYVDYIDQFQRRHRGGYARRYKANLAVNNLIFVAKPKYNYDQKQES